MITSTATVAVTTGGTLNIGSEVFKQSTRRARAFAFQ